MITFMSGRRIVAIAGSAALLAGLGIAAATGPVRAAPATSPAIGSAKSGDLSSCRLGNGIKHVVQLTFDNVHFFRDNPNVPSDLQLMPNLLNFFENNGAFLSNDHTPLIAHTADARLLSLEKARDALAGQIKGELNDAAFLGTPVRGAGVQTVACEVIIAAARTLAAAS
jgi:hypothetical protein